MKNIGQDNEVKKPEDSMPKRQRNSIYMAGVLLFLIVVALVAFLIGKRANRPDEPVEEKESEYTSLTAYGEISKEEMLDYIKTALVRIEVIVADESGNETTMTGSGVIINITDDYIDIATASHVVEMTAYPQVHFYNGDSAKGIVLAYGKESDVAFVRVESESGNGENISAAKCADNDEYAALQVDEEVLLIGSVSTVAGNVEQGIVKEKEKFVELFQNHMLICEASVAGGMSGGGTFTSDGKMIGIIVGTNGTDAVSVAVTDVMAEYRSISY